MPLVGVLGLQTLNAVESLQVELLADPLATVDRGDTYFDWTHHFPCLDKLQVIDFGSNRAIFTSIQETVGIF